MDFSGSFTSVVECMLLLINAHVSRSQLCTHFSNLDTVKPVLCDSSKEERNKVKYDRRSLNTGEIYMNIIALGYENHGHLIQEVFI